MASLFRPRQSFLQLNAWQNQALNALHYNTSQAGSVIAMVYGTTRQPGNVIDLGGYTGPQGKKGKSGSLPLAGTPNQYGKGSGGAKGKGGKKQADFKVDVAFAFAEGPILGFGNIYASTGVAYSSNLPLNYYLGTDGQAADGTFVGLGHTVGYSGTAYLTGTPLDLGPSPVLPNMSAEIQGRLTGTNTGPGYTNDANPANVITDFLTNNRDSARFPSANLSPLVTTGSGLLYGDYCQAAQLLISVSLDGQQKAVEWLDSIAKLTNTAMFFSGGLLHFVPYGDLALSANGTSWTPNLTPVYSIDDSSLLPWRERKEGQGDVPVGEDDPILLTISNPADADNWMAIEYTDRSNFYNTTIIPAFDQGAIDLYDLKMGNVIPGRAFCNPTSAQISLQLALQRKQYIRDTYKVQVGWQYALLDPMDIILLSGRVGAGDQFLSQQPVRVLAIEEDDKGGLTLECEEIQTGTSYTPRVPAIDTATSASALGNGTLSFTLTVSTTKTNDVIVLSIALYSCETGSVPAPVVPLVTSITSTSGLAFTARGSPVSVDFSGQRWCPLITANRICFGTQQVFWAASPGILTGEVITISHNELNCAEGASAIAINGCNLSSPFDPNPSLPAQDHFFSPNYLVYNIPGVGGVTTGGPGTIVSCVSSFSNTGLGFSGGVSAGSFAEQLFIDLLMVTGIQGYESPNILTDASVSGITTLSPPYTGSSIWVMQVDQLVAG